MSMPRQTVRFQFDLSAVERTPGPVSFHCENTAMSNHCFTACTRMYNATPQTEAGWTALLEETARLAGIALDIIPYRFPADIAALWRRPRLALVFICGRAYALEGMRHKPLAAPLRSGPGYHASPLYHTDLLVREDETCRTLQEAAGLRLGWTVEHSHSGCIAPFEYIADVFGLPATSVFSLRGPLHTPPACLEALKQREADIVPLDGYYRSLLEKNAPEKLAGTRVIASTRPYPIPFLAASPDVDDALCNDIADAFQSAAATTTFADVLETLCVSGFIRPRPADYECLGGDAPVIPHP